MGPRSAGNPPPYSSTPPRPPDLDEFRRKRIQIAREQAAEQAAAWSRELEQTMASFQSEFLNEMRQFCPVRSLPVTQPVSSELHFGTIDSYKPPPPPPATADLPPPATAGLYPYQLQQPPPPPPRPSVTVHALAESPSPAHMRYTNRSVSIGDFNHNMNHQHFSLNDDCGALSPVSVATVTDIDEKLDMGKGEISDKMVKVHSGVGRKFNELESVTVKQDDQGPSLCGKRGEYPALYMFDKMPQSDGMCNAGRTIIAPMSIRDKGGGLTTHREVVDAPNEMAICSVSAKQDDGGFIEGKKQVPKLGVEALMVSVIPGDVGKPTLKLDKVVVRDGSCRWENLVHETVKFDREPRTGKSKERLYSFVLSTGSSKASVLGEVSVDFAEYPEATKASSVSLPLKNSSAVLQKLQATYDQREVEGCEDATVKSQDNSLKRHLSNNDADESVLVDKTSNWTTQNAELILAVRDLEEILGQKNGEADNSNRSKSTNDAAGSRATNSNDVETEDEEALGKTSLKNANTAERLQEEFRRLSSQMASTFDANEKVAMKAMTEASELGAQKSRLEELLKKTEEELQASREVYEAKLQKLSNELDEKTREMEQMLLEIQNKSTQLEDQQNQEGDFSEVILQLKAEIERLTRGNNSLSEEVEQNNILGVELGKMKTSIEETEMPIQRGNVERNELLSTIDMLKKEAEKSLEKLNKIKYLMDEKEATIRRLQLESDELKAQCNDLKHTLFEDKVEKGSRKRQVFDLKADLKKQGGISDTIGGDLELLVLLLLSGVVSYEFVKGNQQLQFLLTSIIVLVVGEASTSLELLQNESQIDQADVKAIVARFSHRGLSELVDDALEFSGRDTEVIKANSTYECVTVARGFQKRTMRSLQVVYISSSFKGYVVLTSAMLHKRLYKKKGAAATLWLVQWEGTSSEEATWKDAEDMMLRYPTFDVDVPTTDSGHMTRSSMRTGPHKGQVKKNLREDDEEILQHFPEFQA